jgi:hypothetical protein
MFNETFRKSGAGWIAWVTTVVIFVITLWRNRRRPQKVVCRKRRVTSLVDVKKTVGTRIKVTLDNKVVQNLSLIEFDVVNAGITIINDIRILFNFDPSTKILDRRIKEHSVRAADFELHVGTTEQNIEDIRIPYLNPYSEHRHKIFVGILCDGEVDDVTIIGGGPGWTIQHQQGTPNRTLLSAGLLTALAACLTFVAGLLQTSKYLPLL